MWFHLDALISLLAGPAAARRLELDGLGRRQIGTALRRASHELQRHAPPVLANDADLFSRLRQDQRERIHDLWNQYGRRELSL